MLLKCALIASMNRKLTLENCHDLKLFWEHGCCCCCWRKMKKHKLEMWAYILSPTAAVVAVFRSALSPHCHTKLLLSVPWNNYMSLILLAGNWQTTKFTPLKRTPFKISFRWNDCKYILHWIALFFLSFFSFNLCVHFICWWLWCYFFWIGARSLNHLILTFDMIIFFSSSWSIRICLVLSLNLWLEF